MTSLLLFCMAALAQDHVLYVNGVQADGLRSYEFRSVDVRIDERGNVWVDAPQYHVEVQGNTSGQGTTSSAAAPAVAPQGRYWLVTQDNTSKGHEIEVLVNNVMVQKIRSGDSQLILDIGKYLKVGTNTIVFNALPAGTAYDGGILNVYIGTGSNQGGTLNLDPPMITFARRSTDSPSGASRSFQLEVK